MLTEFSDLIYGYEKKILTSHGYKRYINLDNAASTPPFKSVINVLLEDAAWYSSVHRGAGFKSRHTTKNYEESRLTVSRFVGSDPASDVIIFTKNTTDAINKVSHYLPYLPGEIIVYTRLEHHSNELPWINYKHHCVGLKNDEIDLNQLEEYLFSNKGRVKLLAVSGASNVTGYRPPIYTMAEMAHEAGAKILVDGAQLVPHYPVKVYPAGDPRHLDFLVFSGHKMYAPFGAGVLLGPRELFRNSPPSQVGGGTLKGIGPAGIIWSEPPENEEAGSPNVIGAMALAEACREIERQSWTKLVAHENELLNYTLKSLTKIPGLVLYNKGTRNRIGVVSFNITGIEHRRVAEFLSKHSGIGVRNGCFCARGYVQELLGIKDDELLRIQRNVREGQNYPGPGMVRISFGCYNNFTEIDILTDALMELVGHNESASPPPEIVDTRPDSKS